MAMIIESKENRTEDNVSIQNAFSALRKNMTDHEVKRNAKRTTDWKSGRNKYNEGLDETEGSLKK